MAAKKVIIKSGRGKRSAKKFNFVREMVDSDNPVLGSYRLDAWSAFEKTPMPTVQDEAWRRTDLRKMSPENFQIPAENTEGNGVGEQFFNRPVIPLFFKDRKILPFSCPEDLYPVFGKGIKKSCESQTGAVQVHGVNFPGKAFSSSNTLEMQGIIVVKIQIQKIQNCKCFHSLDITLIF